MSLILYPFDTFLAPRLKYMKLFLLLNLQLRLQFIFVHTSFSFQAELFTLTIPWILLFTVCQTVYSKLMFAFIANLCSVCLRLLEICSI